MYGFIYKTTCLINNKIYIGQRAYTDDEKKDREYLGSGVKIEDCIKSFGEENFKREILKECSCFSGLNYWERYYTRKYDARNEEIGYNINDGPTHGIFSTNPAKSLEVRNKMSRKHKGKTLKEETKKKISEAGKNRKHSEETKMKMRSVKRSESHKQKIRESRLGKEMSEESKEKLRIFRTGSKQTKETKNKIGLGNKGKKISEEHKEKLRQRMKGNTIWVGRKHSEETKEKKRNVNNKKNRN